MDTMFKFKDVNALLDCATKVLEKLKPMFPNVSESDLRCKLIEFMLKNSVFTNEIKSQEKF